MRIRMLRGRKLVHLTDVETTDADGNSGGLACAIATAIEFRLFPLQGFTLRGSWRNAERVADDEPLTCKRCQRLAAAS